MLHRIRHIIITLKNPYHANKITGPCRSIRAEKRDTFGMFSLFINSSHFRASLGVLARAARNPPPPAPANVTP
jgi:hypothetical protein